MTEEKSFADKLEEALRNAGLDSAANLSGNVSDFIRGLKNSLENLPEQKRPDAFQIADAVRNIPVSQKVALAALMLIDGDNSSPTDTADTMSSAEEKESLLEKLRDKIDESGYKNVSDFLNGMQSAYDNSPKDSKPKTFKEFVLNKLAESEKGTPVTPATEAPEVTAPNASVQENQAPTQGPEARNPVR